MSRSMPEMQHQTAAPWSKTDLLDPSQICIMNNCYSKPDSRMIKQSSINCLIAIEPKSSDMTAGMAINSCAVCAIRRAGQIAHAHWHAWGGGGGGHYNMIIQGNCTKVRSTSTRQRSHGAWLPAECSDWSHSQSAPLLLPHFFRGKWIHRKRCGRFPG